MSCCYCLAHCLFGTLDAISSCVSKPPVYWQCVLNTPCAVCFLWASWDQLPFTHTQHLLWVSFILLFFFRGIEFLKEEACVFIPLQWVRIFTQFVSQEGLSRYFQYPRDGKSWKCEWVEGKVLSLVVATSFVVCGLWCVVGNRWTWPWSHIEFYWIWIPALSAIECGQHFMKHSLLCTPREIIIKMPKGKDKEMWGGCGRMGKRWGD